MNRLVKFLSIFTMGLLLAGQIQAADRKAEVTELMEKAIAHFESVGAEQAYKDFSDPNGGFIAGDVYIVVQNMKGDMIHHATNSKLNGKNLIKLKDTDGLLFVKAMVDALKGSDNAWIRYKWSNPATKKIGQKVSYVHKVGSDLFFIVGYFE